MRSSFQWFLILQELRPHEWYLIFSRMRFWKFKAFKWGTYLCLWKIVTRKAIHVHIMMVISEASRPHDWYLILSRIKSGRASWDVLYSGSRSWVNAKLVVVATQAKIRKIPASKVLRGSPLMLSLAVMALSVSDRASDVLVPPAPRKQKKNKC